MIIDKAGNITDRILLLGRKESCVYLVNGGSEYMLVGGGMIHIVPDVLEQLKEFNIDENKISRIVILHAHFDHSGIVPFFKQRWPWARVAASSRAKELLSTEKVIQSMDMLNQGILSMYQKEEKAKNLGISFSKIDVEEVLEDDHIFNCGDLEFKVLAVPGHSTCSIALYLQSEKVLFASDAGGIPSEKGVFCAANSNFDLYQQSLERMAKYDVEVHLPEHFGALTGDDGRNFLHKSIKNATETRTLMEDSLRNTGDVQKSIKEITDKWVTEGRASVLSRDVTEMVVAQMFRYLAKQIL
jgi:2-aminobenzoylacetyl-CoA thioesterase